MVNDFYVGFNADETAFFVVGDRAGKKDFLYCCKVLYYKSEEKDFPSHKYVRPVYYYDADKEPTIADRRWIEDCAKSINDGHILLTNIGGFPNTNLRLGEYANENRLEIERLERVSFYMLAWGVADYFVSDGVYLLSLQNHPELTNVISKYRQWDRQRKAVQVLGGANTRLGEWIIREFKYI